MKVNEAALFPSTRWSVVESARGANPESSKQAIDALFATYWKPVYGYIRHMGRTEQDAEDLTQEFFKQMMVRRNLFLEARQTKGKLRTYVCLAVKRMVVTDARDQGRLKRGGAVEFVPLDDMVSETKLPFEESSPDSFFEYQWAAALMERTLAELEADYLASDKEHLFRELRAFLTSERDAESQQTVADRLGMNIGALRMALVRIRRRFGAIFRANVEQTLLGSSPDEVNKEIVYLIELFQT